MHYSGNAPSRCRNAERLSRRPTGVQGGGLFVGFFSRWGFLMRRIRPNPWDPSCESLRLCARVKPSFEKAFLGGLLRKEIAVMNPCVLRWGSRWRRREQNPRSYDAERRNEWDKDGAGAHDRKCFTFWPKKKVEGETQEGEGAKESKI